MVIGSIVLIDRGIGGYGGFGFLSFKDPDAMEHVSMILSRITRACITIIICPLAYYYGSPYPAMQL